MYLKFVSMVSKEFIDLFISCSEKNKKTAIGVRLNINLMTNNTLRSGLKFENIKTVFRKSILNPKVNKS